MVRSGLKDNCGINMICCRCRLRDRCVLLDNLQRKYSEEFVIPMNTSGEVEIKLIATVTRCSHFLEEKK